MENETPIKITVKFPISMRIKRAIKDFFRKLSGGQHCCNCKVFVDYECEYCYTHKEPFKTVIRTIVPIDNLDNIFHRVKRAFKIK